MRARVGNAAALAEIVETAIAKLTTDELCQRLGDENVPAAKRSTPDEIPDDPQVRHSGSLIESVHPIAGPMRQPRPAARFGPNPEDVMKQVPSLGEHTQDVLAELK